MEATSGVMNSIKLPTFENQNVFQWGSSCFSIGARKLTEMIGSVLGTTWSRPLTEDVEIDTLFPPRPFQWRVTPPKPESEVTSWRDRIFLEEERKKYATLRNEMISTIYFGEGTNSDIILFNQRANQLNSNIDRLYRFYDEQPLMQRLKMEYYSNYSFYIFIEDKHRKAREEWAKENPQMIDLMNQFVYQRKLSVGCSLAGALLMGLRSPTNIGNWVACTIVSFTIGIFCFDPISRYYAGVHMLDESQVRQFAADGIYRKIQLLESKNEL